MGGVKVEQIKTLFKVFLLLQIMTVTKTDISGSSCHHNVLVDV